MKGSLPSTSTQLQWHLSYAEYFARIDNVAKARQHMTEAGEIYNRNFAAGGKRIDRADRAERILAVGRAGFVLSLIAFEESELEKAIGCIDYAIKVLKTGITATEKSGRIKSVPRDDDPFALERPPPSVEKVDNSTSIQFDSKVWKFKSVWPL
jgi:hypothetical protein